LAVRKALRDNFAEKEKDFLRKVLLAFGTGAVAPGSVVRTSTCPWCAEFHRSDSPTASAYWLNVCPEATSDTLTIISAGQIVWPGAAIGA
jgi:hypothetical protein